MADVRSINAIRADRQNDNALLSPIECLDDCAAGLRAGEACDKLLILRLTVGDGSDYSVGFSACKLSSSEMLALLEVAKLVVLQHMGYVS